MRRLIVGFALAGGLIVGCDDNLVRGPTDKDINQITREDADLPVTATEVAPDNSAVNQRDRDSEAKTPLDQSNTQADIDITAKIRQRVVDLPGLSVNARNVKIVTADGKVTLRGPVAHADERTAIEKIAKDVAGAEKVESQLEIVEK
jgi:hyperosmotically inducible protein